jgi:Protein of unknown function (DUF3224)
MTRTESSEVPRKEALMSTTSRIRLLVVAVAALLAAVAASGAAASPPISASGTFTYTSSTFNSIQEAGGNLIIDLSSTVSYTGTFTGTATLHGTLIFHANGTATFQDVETFTGTVNGVPGTVTLRLDGHNRAGVITATDVIISATGELAGLHGVLSEVATLGAEGPVGTYSGEIVTGS